MINKILPVVMIIGVTLSIVLIVAGILPKENISTVEEYYLYDNTYMVNIHLVITDNIDSAYDRITAVDSINISKYDFNGAAGLTYYYGNIVVWLRNFSYKPEDLAVFNHEMQHVVAGILGNAGIYLTPASEEAFAYETQFLSREFYKLINNERSIH